MGSTVYVNESESPSPEHNIRIELLKKKLSLIQRIRDLTASTELSCNHAEEHYITLMTRREAIMTQLKELDLLLSKTSPDESDNVLLSRIGEASKEVLEMDNELASRIPELMRGLKNHLKQLKDGKNISRAYHKGIIGESSFSLKK